MLALFLLTITAWLLYWVLQKLLDKARGLPPGPFRFPLIGCTPQVLMIDPILPFIAFQKMCKTYKTDILYVQLGVVKAVVINGYEANKQILSSEDWLGRNQEKWMIARSFGKGIGLVHADVDHWRETRRFCVKALREFGFGVKKDMEAHIADQVAEISDNLRKSFGNGGDKEAGLVQVKHLFDLTMFNATWTLVIGKPFERGDPRLQELFVIMDGFFKSCALGAGLLSAYPFLVDWAPKLVKFDKQQDANVRFHAFFRTIIKEFRAAGSYKEHPSTFVEVFLQKIDEVEKVDPGNTIFTEENLISILYDFFLGSTETTTNTTSMSILYLIRYPEIQEKVAKEVEAVIGRNRPAAMADRDKMPYTNATILELFRLTCILPLAPRKLHKDATFGPYRIPKDTTVFPSFWSVCYDENVWEDPEIFKPERFLDASGQNVINADKIMPFSMGKRNCIGESVARTTFFMLFTGLLQQFEFSMNPEAGKPSLVPDLGITLMPKPYIMVVKARH